MSIEPPGNAVFGEIMDDYLAQLAKAWDVPRLKALGVEADEERAFITFLGHRHEVSLKGVTGPDGSEPHHAVKVILCKYLIAGDPGAKSGGEWVAYRQFPDAAPFVVGFLDTVENKVARHFTERLEDLKKQCEAFGARPGPAELSYDLNMEFQPLPLVPVLLLFNDQDGPLPVSCKVLFREGAATQLDMECLAMIGQILAAWLCREQGSR